MGFTTGFIGGVTLTTTLLYLSLSLHERTRLHQSQLLARQSLLLDELANPSSRGPASRSLATTDSRASSASPGLSGRLKDRWNAELEGNVKRVYATDWRAVREDLEDRVAGVWARAFGGAREAVERGGQAVKGEAEKVVVAK